jgi:FeoC-like transcriptional regulator
MLEKLLQEIRSGGSLETHVLATRYGASPELMEAMLAHLQRLGLIQGYAACSDGCKSCGLSESCNPRHPVRLWQSVSPF